MAESLPPTGQPARKQVLRPAVVWTAVILVAMGLAVFVGIVVVPFWQTREAVLECHDRVYGLAPATASLLSDRDWDDVLAQCRIDHLGEPGAAARRLAFYMRMPEALAPHKPAALGMLSQCGRPAIEPLTAALNGKDRDCRRWGVRALIVLGKDAGPAVPALIEVLRDREDRDCRFWALQALASIGKDASPAVPALVEALGDRDSDIQTHASWALTAIGPDAREAIPSLVQLIRAEQARVYEPRYSFLRTPNGQVLKMEYRPALEVERSVVAAIEALSCIDVEGKTVLPVLIGALTEHFSFFREASADSLMNLGPSARPAAPMLLTCLDDSDDSVRLAAAGAYWRATGEVERPLDVFSDVFSRLRMPRYARHREASPRWRKDIRVLREMAGAARRDVRTAGAKLKLITALVAMLDMPDPELQAAAQDALDTIFSDGSTEAAAVAAWKRTSEVVRHTDSEALKSLGGPEQALPKLQLYLQLPSWVAPDKDEAAGLLVSCGADKAAAILAEALPSPEVEMRRVAASAIPFCPTAKSALIHALDDTDEIVRARVARVMGSSPPGDPEVLALLTEALGDISGEARVSAAVALLRISKEHAEAKSVLDECMEGQDAGLRRYFMWEMRNRGMALSPGILQLLLKGLGDRYYDVRESAAWTLCGFGPAAKSAIPALEALAEKDPSEEVRKSAAEAIRAIRRGPEEPEK